MARKTGSLVCLSLDALRRLPAQTKGRSNGVARRTFLAGAAVAAVSTTSVGKAAAHSLSPLRIKRKLDKSGNLRALSIGSDSKHFWTIDLSLFDGTPSLALEEDPKGTLVKLSGARLPGTGFTIDFEALISSGILSRRVQFTFTDTGVQGQDFDARADFDAWVLGDDRISARVDLGKAMRGLHPSLGLEASGQGELDYLPSGGFEVSGGRIQCNARNLGLASFMLLPERGSDLTTEGFAKVTRIIGQADGSWNGQVQFKTNQGWMGFGSLKGFDRVEAEIHSPEVLLLTLEGDGPFDLKAKAENHIEFKLDRARLLTLVQPGCKTEVLSAKLHEKGTWIDLPGVSIEVGPNGEEAEALFACVESPSGDETFADIQGGIRNASFLLDGAVTRTRTKGIEPVALLSWEDQGGRPVTIQPGGGVQRPVGGRLDITSVPKFRLTPFRLEVVRKEDMLAVTFEFVNLAFQGGGQATIVHADTSKPAYIAVIFPPQNLAEAQYQEDAQGNPQLPSGPIGQRPIPSRLSGESRLVFWIPPAVTGIHFSLQGEDGKGKNGLLDWNNWRQSITATAVSSYGHPKIRIDSAYVSPLAGVTVKTRNIGAMIRPPGEEESDAGLIGSLRRLASKRGPVGQVRTEAAVAQQPRINVTNQLGRLTAGIDPTVVFQFIPKARIEPSALHTQLEMPIRLILSPNETAGWSHDATPDADPQTHRFPLWHTRLGTKLEGGAGTEPAILLYSDDGKSFYRKDATGTSGPFPLSTPAGPTVRAIDALDWSSNIGSASSAPMYPVIPDNGPQEYIIDYKSRTMLVDSMCWRGVGNADTEPFNVENLMLTSLGGYLKGEWIWRQPTGWPDATKPALITWRHVSTLGRDQYIKLVFKGYLFPTGHKAVLTVIAERKFLTTTNGKVVAYMRSRRFVAIRDPLVTFSQAEQQRLGFSSITCTTAKSPILDVFNPNQGYGTWSGVQKKDEIMLVYSGNAPFPFQMKAIDQEGRAVVWGQPSVFIRSDRNVEVSTVQKIVTEWEKDDKTNSLAGASKRSRMFGQNVAFAKGGGKTPKGEDAEDNTTYPANDMMLTGKVNTTPTWIVDLPRWKAELFKANISAPAVQMMQGKPPTMSAIHFPDESFDMEALHASMDAAAAAYEGDDGFDVKIPDVFKDHGFGGGNKSQMFLELVDKYAPKFGDVSKTGGIANPNMAIQGLSKGKGPIGGDMADILNGDVDPQKLLDTTARLLGAVKIFDILPNPIKIDPGGPESPYIEVLLDYDDGKSKPPTGAKVAIIWKPPLQNWSLVPGEAPLFYVKSFKSPDPGFTGAAELKLEGSIKTKFKGGGKPETVFRGSISNFRVDLISPASFLLLDFRVVEFIAEVGKPFDVNVDLSKMTFTGPLTFIQKLQDLLNGGGQGMKVLSTDPDAYLKESALSTADPGIDVFFDIDETGIRCGLTITVPSVSVGMFAVRNISVGVKLTLPFFGDPLSVRFNFCERNNTFQISVMMVTGGGFVAMEINIDGWMTLEAALEFGGSLSFDIGVASGGVSIMAGIYFRLDVQDGTTQCMVEAYIRLQGNLSVLGIIRISLEFYLSLTYYSDGNRLVGTATLTVEIEILFFSISVSMTVQRQIAGEKSGGSYFFASMSDPDALPAADETTKFTEVVTQAQFVEYCEAFA